jgi:hypothetical protein
LRKSGIILRLDIGVMGAPLSDGSCDTSRVAHLGVGLCRGFFPTSEVISVTFLEDTVIHYVSLRMLQAEHVGVECEVALRVGMFRRWCQWSGRPYARGMPLLVTFKPISCNTFPKLSVRLSQRMFKRRVEVARDKCSF